MTFVYVQSESPPNLDDTSASFALSVTLVAALATVTMLEASRVFLSYTVFAIDPGELGLIALTAAVVCGVFAAGGLGTRLLPPRFAVAITVALLVTSRLVLQFVDRPEARLLLGAIALITWGWMLPSLRAIRPVDAARGVVYGLLLDVAVRFLFGTVDLPWMPTTLRDVSTLVLAGALAVSLAMLFRAGSTVAASGAGPSLIGVGPGLALFHLLLGNFGSYEVKSDLPIQASVLVVAVGIGAGFAMQIGPPSGMAGRASPSGWAVAAVLTLLALLGLAAFWYWDGPADPFLLVVAGIASQLLVLSVRGRPTEGSQRSVIDDGIWLALGMLLQAALLFIYHATTGAPMLIGLSVALLGLGAALSSPFRGYLPPMSSGRHLPAMIVGAAAILLLGLVVNRGAWAAVEHDEILDADLTVVTYNLQSGFALDDEWDLARQADVIERIDPDILLLQEVSRGWVIASGVDQARWLSHRLDMNLIWGPSSRDKLFGIAILTRGDVLGSEMRLFDLTENLHRGVLGAGIATHSGTLYVYNTHLGDPATGDAVRFEQVTQLVEIADGLPSILGGDFNAPPGSAVIETVLAAGFVDTGATLPADLSTRSGAPRIDYIFVQGDIRVDGIEVLDESASDHKPVVARLTVSR